MKHTITYYNLMHGHETLRQTTSFNKYIICYRYVVNVLFRKKINIGRKLIYLDNIFEAIGAKYNTQSRVKFIINFYYKLTYKHYINQLRLFLTVQYNNYYNLYSKIV